MNSPSILKCVWFGLLVSFWFFQTWSDLGFSADAHRHQVSFGLSFISSRLVSGLCTPWALVSTSLNSRLYRLGIYSVTQHSPLCTNCLWWVLLIFYMMFYVFLYLLCRSRLMRRIATKYKTSTISSLHWWCGAWDDIWGKLALTAVRQCSSSWGKETVNKKSISSKMPMYWTFNCFLGC